MGLIYNSTRTKARSDICVLRKNRVYSAYPNYEDAVRKAVSLGGDSDTIACMAGAVAEAYYGMPENLKAKAMRILDPYCREIVEEFERFSST